MKATLLVWLGLALAPLAVRAADSAAPLAPLKIAAAGNLKNDPKIMLSVGPLVDYLQAGLGRPVQLENFPGYDDVLGKLGAGGFDLAILPPVVNMHATEKKLSRPLAFGIYPSGRYTYVAYILARKGDPKIKTLSDLKGQKVGFVDASSASGFVYPKQALIAAGIRPKDVEDVFCGNHLEALKALESGKVAAAAVYELLFDPATGSGKKLADYDVLATTKPIPAEAIVAASHLAAATADSVQDLLFSFYARRSEKPAWQEGRFIGFIPPDPFVLTGVKQAFDQLSR